jgi:hypothetical protein
MALAGAAAGENRWSGSRCVASMRRLGGGTAGRWRGDPVTGERPEWRELADGEGCRWNPDRAGGPRYRSNPFRRLSASSS